MTTVMRNDWGLNKNPEQDLKKITFDDHVDDTEVQDLNIANVNILHIYDDSDLSSNVGVQHNQEDQHNHFGGPAANKDDPDKHLNDHVEGDNVNEEDDEDAQAYEGVHLVGDDELSTDDNFDIFGHGVQDDKSVDESAYESAEEYDEPNADPVEDPV